MQQQTRTESFHQVWESPPGVRGFFTDVQHKVVGTRYMVTAFVFFLVGGVQALLMRVQLSRPENDFLDAQSYNELFTMHGTTMMFLFAVPFLEGLATYLLPLQIGCRDMPFPRYNIFNYWCYLAGGLLLYSSFIVDMVPDGGWFAYVPLSGPEFSDKAMDIWLFGLTLAELAAIGAAIEIVVAVLRMRAPGMSLDRVPIFAWTMLAVGFLIIIAFIPLIVGSVLLEMDRATGTAFFDHSAGGDPLLWQHLFWIFGHPEVYVMFLPGAAVISHVIPVHARAKLVAYPLVVVAVITTALMSLGLWVHHMYSVGLPPLTLSFFSAASMAITLASGIQIFAWISTLWLGKPRFTIPMLYALGFIVTFVAGGITGVMVASAGFNAQVHDTYFIVAHLHYVLIGGMLFPIFAALYHWWPKFTGRIAEGAAGHVAFWLIFVGFHTTFFPMHLTGMWGMVRRVYTYAEGFGLDFVNLLSTVGAFILAAGVLTLIVSLLAAYRSGRPAGRDPWQADSLEWFTDSPVSDANWTEIPAVTSRHPGWDNVEPPAEHTQMARAFDTYPDTFRASPMTSTVQADPVGAVHLPSPTIWPLVPPVGLVLTAVGLLVESYLVGGLGLAVLLAGLGGWAYRSERDMDEQITAPIASKYKLESLGPAGIGWWAGLSAGVVLIIGVSTIAFSAFYLQVNAASWPGSGLVDQPVLSVAVLVLCALGLGGTWWGSQLVRGRDRTAATMRVPHVVAALAALLAAGAAAMLVVVIWVRAGLDPTTHAYNSAMLVLLAAQVLVIAFAAAGTSAALLSRLLHRRDSRPGIMLQNSAIVWAASIVTWIVVWASADLLPIVVP